jgi:hypothetical protein
MTAIKNNGGQLETKNICATETIKVFDRPRC